MSPTGFGITVRWGPVSEKFPLLPLTVSPTHVHMPLGALLGVGPEDPGL